MLLKDYQALVENGSYLSEEDNKFVLHEIKNGKSDDYLNTLGISQINSNKYIPQRYELIRVNSYNPRKETIENDMHISGVYVYVPPKKSIHIMGENKNVVDEYPTVIKFENILVFCSFDDLHCILNKVLKCKEKKAYLSVALNCDSTKINKDFWKLSDEECISIEIELYNMCKDPDLMKTVSPWVFVSEFIEDCEIDFELINDDNYFWGVVEYNNKYYKHFYVWDKCYATELVNCYPTDMPDEKLPANVHRIMFPEENDNAIGIAYKRGSDVYYLRIWIKIEEYIKNFYKKSNYVDTEEEIKACVCRHLSILKEDKKPLYYQLEKEVPPILFIHDRQRIISECAELLTDIVKGELSRHLYGV